MGVYVKLLLPIMCDEHLHAYSFVELQLQGKGNLMASKSDARASVSWYLGSRNSYISPSACNGAAPGAASDSDVGQHGSLNLGRERKCSTA